MTPRPDPIRIGTPTQEVNAQGWSQVSADVDGTRVFFSSPDLSLDANSEALGTSFLIPAMIAQRPLEFVAPVSTAWMVAAHKVMDLTRRWWGYAPILITAGQIPVRRSPAYRETALFFSGGVDAFHTLLKSGPTQALVFVHGFDIWLNERASIAARKQEEETRRIAAERGMQAILIRTTVRAHPLFSFDLRSRTGGSVMSGIAHLLRQRHGIVKVASSCECDAHTLPWGTHPDLDPLWGAGALDIIHFGAEVPRAEKVRLISRDPEIARSLRVCWKPSAGQLNCGRCEKCLHTMILLQRAGIAEYLPTLTPPDHIAKLIDELAPTSEYRLRYWTDEALSAASPEVRAAAHRFIDRTRLDVRLQKTWPGRAYLRIRRKLGIR